MQKIDGLSVIHVDESGEADDLLEGDTANPDRHPSPSLYVGNTTSMTRAGPRTKPWSGVARSGSATMSRASGYSSSCSSSCKRQ